MLGMIFNSTATLAEKDVLPFPDTVRELHIVHAFAAIALATTLLSGFEAGRQTLRRIIWSFNSWLGGAPHTVDLPGPPGPPLIGNLFAVSPSAWTQSFFV